MKKNKQRMIFFIIFVSVFALLWVASLVFLGISTLSENTKEAIQDWYANRNEDKTIDLLKISIIATIISTSGLLITLLFKELRKKYLSNQQV